MWDHFSPLLPRLSAWFVQPIFSLDHISQTKNNISLYRLSTRIFTVSTGWEHTFAYLKPSHAWCKLTGFSSCHARWDVVTAKIIVVPLKRIWISPVEAQNLISVFFNCTVFNMQTTALFHYFTLYPQFIYDFHSYSSLVNFTSRDKRIEAVHVVTFEPYK